MAAWTADRIVVLRQRGATLRKTITEPDHAAIEAPERRQWVALDAEQERTAAYAAGLYQGQQRAQNPEAAAEYDPRAEIYLDPGV